MTSATPSTDYEQKIRRAIETQVFATTEAQRTSQMGGGSARWLFDFRAVMLQSDILNAYAELFFEKHRDTYPFQVCGIEIAAVPLVAAIVMKFHEKGFPINGFFIRKSRKKSGLLKMIEGVMTEDPVILVDDLVNSGSSIIRQIEILREEKKEIKAIFSILRFRDLSCYTYFKEANIPFTSLFELNDFNQSLGVTNLTQEEKKENYSPFEKKILWFFKGKDPNFFHVNPKSGPVISDDRVYVGTDSGFFYALDIETGTELWNYKVPFGHLGKKIFSTPLVYNDTVFFGAYDGNFYALDAKTGNRKWTFMEADWIGSSPCVSHNLSMIFVGLEYGLFKKRGGVVGMDIKTGKKIWEFRSEDVTHGSPAYSEKFNVIGCGSNDGVFNLLDAKTGSLLWSHKTNKSIRYAPCFSDKHGLVVVLGLGEIVYVLKTKTGELVSEYKMDFGGYSTPLIIGDQVVCTSLDKNVHCFEILSGKPLWKFETGARCFATPELVEGKIYVGSNNACLFEIDPETGKGSVVFHTRERIVNKIAYDATRKIFLVPTFANEIFALRKE